MDVLTLSPIYLPDDGIEKFVNLAVKHNPKVRVFVQENWLPCDIYDKTVQDAAGEGGPRRRRRRS